MAEMCAQLKDASVSMPSTQTEFNTKNRRFLSKKTPCVSSMSSGSSAAASILNAERIPPTAELRPKGTQPKGPKDTKGKFLKGKGLVNKTAEQTTTVSAVTSSSAVSSTDAEPKSKTSKRSKTRRGKSKKVKNNIQASKLTTTNAHDNLFMVGTLEVNLDSLNNLALKPTLKTDELNKPKTTEAWVSPSN
jgi:hypothetical protein